MEKCSVCVDSSFRKQSGKRNGENPLLFCNPHSLCICRFGKISCLIWGESRTDKVTHLAGNPLRPKSSTDAQFLKIFIIILDISDLQSVNGIRQFLQLPFQLFKPLVNGWCILRHNNLLSHVVTDSTGFIYKAVSGYIINGDFGSLAFGF